MNNEELYKRILNKVCIHFGYDVAHDLEYLFLVKEQEIEKLNNKLNAIRKYLKDNEQEYGSLEDNEKIILDILNGDSNE